MGDIFAVSSVSPSKKKFCKVLNVILLVSPDSLLLAFLSFILHISNKKLPNALVVYFFTFESFKIFSYAILYNLMSPPIRALSIVYTSSLLVLICKYPNS